MSTYRTAKVGEAFYSLFTVFDTDGITPVSGEGPGDFTVRFSLNDQPAVAPAHTIVEIGTTGDYVVSVPGGFPSKGLWAVTVEVAYNSSTWRDEVEVRTYDVDDVYTIIIAGGSGVETVTLTLVDTGAGDIPIADARVQIYNATGQTYITFQITDTNGEVTLLLDDGTYVVRVYKPGYTSTDQTLVVADTGGTTPQTDQIEAASITVTPPASPSLCRMYADFVTQDGLPYEGFKIQVENLFDPESSAGLSVIEPARTYATDAAGHLEFDVVRGTRVRVALLTTPLTRDIVVPDASVQSLLTAFGAATDAFQLVKRT